MKSKLTSLLGAVLLSGLVFAAAPGQRVKYQMLNCGDYGTDENGKLKCAPPPQSQCSKGTCTGTAPTASTEGLSLQGLTAFRLTVCAPLYDRYVDGGPSRYSDGGLATYAEVLKGDGGMLAYYYHSGEGVWIPSSFNQSVTATDTRCQVFPDLQVGGQFDRVMFVPSNVWVQLADGGATDAGMDVLLDGQATQGQHWN